MIKIASNLKVLVKYSDNNGFLGIDTDKWKQQAQEAYDKTKGLIFGPTVNDPTAFNPNNPHPHAANDSTWFNAQYGISPYSPPDMYSPYSKDSITLRGVTGIKSLVNPDVFHRSGTTTPKKQFELIYGDKTDRLMQDARDWQSQNPRLQSPWTPVYSDSTLNREIPIYTANSPVINAAYGRIPEPGEAIDIADILKGKDIFNTKEFFINTNSSINPYGLQHNAASFSTPDAAISEDQQIDYDFRVQNNGNIKHGPFSLPQVIGVHEATHSLGPATAQRGLYSSNSRSGEVPEDVKNTGIPENQQSLLGKGKNLITGDPIWSSYGLKNAELPAHISEMKARMFINEKELPDFKTPEGRQKFIDFWDKAINSGTMPKRLMERYLPVVNYLKSAHPLETENILRSIVRNNTENQTFA
jgi:hypothetical protein